MKLLRDFRSFVLRGNVIDLAVAVVVGVAFGAVVTAFVRDLLTPLITIPGKADFSRLTFTINHSTFRYGEFLNALTAFLIIAATIFFLVVRPLVRLRRPEPDTPKRDCPECLSSIPAAARRCAYCTAEVGATGTSMK
jgi:large conductance mechanosensitive channel